MDKYLLFQLYSPMASWGDIAVGEERPSLPHPGRSAILGLLAAALGLTRDQDDRLEALAQGYKIAVRVDSFGGSLRDYHTTQVPPQVALKRHPHATRRDELAALEDYQRRGTGASGTILSFRDYRTDACYRVIVAANEAAPFSLEDCCHALMQPRFVLYLGRKSCPPALRLQPQVVSAMDVLDALGKASFTGLEQLLGLDAAKLGLGPRAASLFWEDGMRAGMAPRETPRRYDQPRSRRRWQFASRAEHHASLAEDA